MRTPFDGATCSAPDARAERMRDIVIEHAPLDRPIQLLDVGCGTGSLAFQLASALPLASVIGVDVSAANVEAAASRNAAESSGSRVRFERADYLQYATAPADVIVADTVLHFIAGRREVLWGKLGRDLRSGGVLVCCMAYDGAHNRVVDAVRRCLRLVRCAWADALLLALARRLYGGQMSDTLLRERTEYMYIPPEQFMTARVRDELAPACGLRAIAELDVAATSATQLKQRVTVFRKDCELDV
jgi:SAM-dependent methyltransferase